MKKLLTLIFALAVCLSLFSPVLAADAPRFEYELRLSDAYGMPVENPRCLSPGDTLNAEIVLTRRDISTAYDIYGIEFRLMTRGLEYSNDGQSLMASAPVRESRYSEGESVGFAWYDMGQKGERINNSVSAGSWSYTVKEPGEVNILVPVALVYVPGHSEAFMPGGKALLRLEVGDGALIGSDMSGEYASGTAVVLPGAQLGAMVFAGWSDGVRLYPAGSEYTVSGIVSLVPVWEEPVRDRHISFDLKGGQLSGTDISGLYAEGELLRLPDAQLEGFVLSGWDDGAGVYAPGEEYRVYNSLTLSAVWEKPSSVPDTGETSDEHAEVPDTPSPAPDARFVIISCLAAALIVLVAIFVLLRRRRKL